MNHVWIGPAVVTAIAFVLLAVGVISWWGVSALVVGSMVGLSIATLRWRHYQRKVEEWNKSIERRDS